jgi:tetratricopeptide (TPR) repeat protein
MVTHSIRCLRPEASHKAQQALRSVVSAALLAALLTIAGTGNVWAIAGVDFSSYEVEEAQAAIDESDFEEAITMLEEIIFFEPEDTEALNLLGFSLRSTGRFDEAMGMYKEALSIDPNHQGALEYQGELFLKLGDQASAEANLQILGDLCPDGCEAHAVLETAIEKFKDGVELSWVKAASSD